MSVHVRPPLLLAVMSTAVLALSGCSLPGDSDDTTRNESGEIEEGGELGVFSFTVGDCFNQGGATEDGAMPQVEAVEGVPCAEPHDAQVFHLFDVTDAEEFPGEESLQVTSEEGCLAEFEAFVGAAYEESVLYSSSFTPTAGSWAQGDREVVCLLVGENGEKLTQDHRDSGA
ncbi:MAG: septum formation family protein [Kineosporiaceae bacterium]